MAVAQDLMTVEQFEQLAPPEDCRYELVEGRLLTVTFPTPKHNRIAKRVLRLLDDFVEGNGLGEVFVMNTGFILSQEPGTLRGPDVAFLTNESLAGLDSERNIVGAPDLAVEVVSPNDRVQALRAKVDQYLEAGTRAVWVLDPNTREVKVFEPGRAPRVLISSDTLESPELFPGFSVRVADLFPER